MIVNADAFCEVAFDGQTYGVEAILQSRGKSFLSTWRVTPSLFASLFPSLSFGCLLSSRETVFIASREPGSAPGCLAVQALIELPLCWEQRGCHSHEKQVLTEARGQPRLNSRAITPGFPPFQPATGGRAVKLTALSHISL